MADDSQSNGEVTESHGPHRFKKGEPRPANAGRRAGTPNRITVTLRDAIIEAAEWAGFLKWNDETKRYDQAGEEGLVGYMKFLAVHDRPLFVPLLGKVLPYHAAAAVVHRKYRTEDEVRQLCAERGIPFESMLDLAIPAEEVLDLEAEDGDE
jgi:hypothetical protein